MTALAFIGSLILTALGFIIGRFYSESEKILSEKRTVYAEFLRILPPPNDTYEICDESKMHSALRPATEQSARLLFYADPSVCQAWSHLQQCYWDAFSSLTHESPPLAEEFKALAKAQNDLVLEMRRDAFRWSIFNYGGASRSTVNKSKQS